MTTPADNSRAVLSDIPDRLEALHVAGSPDTTIETPDDTMHTYLFNLTGYYNPLRNIQWQQEFIASPVLPPEEVVIRQRGRRRFTLSWSPEKTPSNIPFQKTPTKRLNNQMILRSSPRKRLAMLSETQYPPISPAKSNGSPHKGNGNRMTHIKTPVVKKLRLDEKPIGQLSIETPLPTLLKGLSHEQLIGIISNLVKSDTDLEKKVRNDLPIPDVSYMEEELAHIKRNIFKSLPTSRLCKKTDSIAYARASTHLAAFRKTIITRTRVLHDSTHWDALLDYVTMAWNYVRATPVWDNNAHNLIRRQCFKALSCHCVSAVKYGGQRLGTQRLHKLEQNLKEWSKDYEDVITCANSLSKTMAKYRVSL